MTMTKLVFLSDTHNRHKSVEIPECDVLCHCGDFAGRGLSGEIKNFLKWFSDQPATFKVFIAGNHDKGFEDAPGSWNDRWLPQFPDLVYLENTGVTLCGLDFWGSPWTPEFNNWAFNYPRRSKFARDLWNSIPQSTDVLLTHGPPHGILDGCKFRYGNYPQQAGCEYLREKIESMSDSLQVHAFGHIHEASGREAELLSPLLLLNVSICNLDYDPINLPAIVEV
jgi:Icc-related predicted phosphoesterase